MEERIQYEMKSREAVAAANVNLAPPFRTGTASFATSAAVASAIANRPVPDAADVMTGQAANAANANAANSTRATRRKAAAAAKAAGNAPVVSLVGVSHEGGSTASTDVPKAAAKAGKAPAPAGKAPPPKAATTRPRSNS